MSLIHCSTFAMNYLFASFGRKNMDSKLHAQWEEFYNNLWKPWIKKYGGFVNKEGLEKIMTFPVS